ncbi:hypothetical protein KAU08_03930 [bacterium]|nr:hypothetical protein [bacterium]
MDKEPLGGVQPLSIRVHFLRNLAKKGNPVLKWGARYLLTDPVSRLNGIYYEAIVMIGFTVLTLLTLLSVMYRPETFEIQVYDYIITYRSYLILISIFFLIFWLAALVKGIITSTRFVNAMLNNVSHEETPDWSEAHPDGVFNSIMTLQMCSVGIPYGIYVLVTFIITYYFMQFPVVQEYLVQHSIWRFGGSVSLIMEFVCIMFLTLGATFTGARYSYPKVSVWRFIGLMVVNFLLYLIIFFSLCFFNFSQSGRDTEICQSNMLTFTLLWGIGVVYVLFLLARNEVRSKIKKLQKSD